MVESNLTAWLIYQRSLSTKKNKTMSFDFKHIRVLLKIAETRSTIHLCRSYSRWNERFWIQQAWKVFFGSKKETWWQQIAIVKSSTFGCPTCHSWAIQIKSEKPIASSVKKTTIRYFVRPWKRSKPVSFVSFQIPRTNVVISRLWGNDLYQKTKDKWTNGSDKTNT
jgi:hypothetical protein